MTETNFLSTVSLMLWNVFIKARDIDGLSMRAVFELAVVMAQEFVALVAKEIILMHAVLFSAIAAPADL